MGKYKNDPVLVEVMDDLFGTIQRLDQAARARHLPPPVVDRLNATRLVVFKQTRRLNEAIELHLEIT